MLSATGNEGKKKAPSHSPLKKEPQKATTSDSEPLQSHRKPLLEKKRPTIVIWSLARVWTPAAGGSAGAAHLVRPCIIFCPSTGEESASGVAKSGARRCSSGLAATRPHCEMVSSSVGRRGAEGGLCLVIIWSLSGSRHVSDLCVVFQ